MQPEKLEHLTPIPKEADIPKPESDARLFSNINQIVTRFQARHPLGHGIPKNSPLLGE